MNEKKYSQNQVMGFDLLKNAYEYFRTLSPFMKKNRSPVSPDNPFLSFEKNVSDSIVTILDNYQSIRDRFEESLFFAIYENPWMKLLFPETSQKKTDIG